jgi:hypothetical protein
MSTIKRLHSVHFVIRFAGAFEESNGPMASDIHQDEIRAFYEFLGHRLRSNDRGLTPEESVRGFRLYQEELQRFVQETQAALDQTQRGQSKPLDVDALMKRVRDSLASEGISD